MQPSHADTSERPATRAEVVDHLRRLLPRLETTAGARPAPFGLPALDGHLPQGGLAGGALHEIAPSAAGDLPAALGFVAAILGRLPPPGPLLFVAAPQAVFDGYRLHGHGLNGLGLDPGRLILVDTPGDQQTLWAMEQALQSGAPAAVAGMVERLDLKASQRLHHAAADTGRLLLLLRPAAATGSSVAVTRWRIGAAQAARDRFGLVTGWRWTVALERCRNGRPGQWLVEFDHAAHRFSLAQAVAGAAPARGPEPQRRIAAGHRS
jgi:protein ImuA